jgi:hypothetical protein
MTLDRNSPDYRAKVVAAIARKRLASEGGLATTKKVETDPKAKAKELARKRAQDNLAKLKI